MIAAVKVRHQSELEEMEAKLFWGSLLYLKTKKFVDRE
jgi:hypothetical protein